MRFLKYAIVWAVSAAAGFGQTVFVEAEGFAEHGGWKLDTQFIEIMGSPYLNAHGLGKPVDDAVTKATFPEAGTYRVWVRTKDWVGPWDAPGAPGRFQVQVGGKAMEMEFGTEGSEWHWQEGGEVEIVEAGEVEIRLKDQTGFNGRCDALVFSKDPDFKPDNSSEILPAWRRQLLGLPEEPIDAGEFDIVFVGGGYAGTAGAISAARMGLKVALIQNRHVLGGNGSSEIRVWAMGNTPGGLYPVGDIIRELEDDATSSPGFYEEFEDDKKEKITLAEENLSLFLGHHAYQVEMDGNKIASVLALETNSGAIRRFEAPLFCDCTGHGYIGMKAGADRTQIPKGRMGMSNMWRWENADTPQEFPKTPWALDLNEGEFPYPKKFHAQWFWESGYDKDPLNDLELIRDWNLRANFGAFNAMKNRGAYARSDETGNAHKNARLLWMAYIGGPRETQQLLGDVILTEEDVVNKRKWDDGCVLSTWSIDLHYPQERYIGKYEDNPFISRAVHGKGVDRSVGYAVPYRCFYSRNIDNLFMAGRNVSVTHEALGTVRVMKTCGMMGVVVGKAAAVATKNDCSPRYVYQSYLPELIELLKLPGNVRRDDLGAPFGEDPQLPKFEPMDPYASAGGVNPAKIPGIVIDDKDAKKTGDWKSGRGLKGFIGTHYLYHGPGGGGSVRFDFKVEKAGIYDVRIAYQIHENRSSKTLVKVESGEELLNEQRVNQKTQPTLPNGFFSLGEFEFEAGQEGSVTIFTEGADGNAHADAIQVFESK
ncbi:MAG: FAD-dependent oxidoreductase [Verrucomicrobiota bacterium]